MSNAVTRRIATVLLLAGLLFSSLAVLTAPAVAATVPAAQETGTSPASSPMSSMDVTSDEGGIPLELAVQRVDPSLQDLVLSGAKDDVEVLVFTMDVPALARVMEKYPYEGLLGPNAAKTDIPVVIYLKTPAYALQDVSQMTSTLFILKEERLAPDVMEMSPEALGAESGAPALPRSLSADEIQARKLGLPERSDDIKSTIEGLWPSPVSEPGPGPEPTDSFDTGIHQGAAANAAGYTGAGVNVAEVDLGVDFGHPELWGTWAVFDVTRVPAPVLAQKPYLANYDGWPLALNPDGVNAYLAGKGLSVSTSHGFVVTDTVLQPFPVGADNYIRWRRDSPFVTPLNFLGIPMSGTWGGTGYPDVYFNPAEPVTRQPFTVPAGTVQMNIQVPFTCVDIDAALVYDTDNDGVPELGELVAWEETSTGANPEVFLPITNPATANRWWVLLLAFDATACTTDVNIQFVSIVTQDTDYRVTGIVSMSNNYHVGKFWDSRLVAKYFMRPGVLAVDLASQGDYDTVYVDLDNDFDFTDETAITAANPVATHDIPVDLDGDGSADPPDGLADLSSGAVIYIANAGTRTNVAVTVGNVTVSGTTAVGGEIWAQLQDGNVTVNRIPTIFLNGAPWSVVAVGPESLAVTPNSQALQLRVRSNIVSGSVVLQGTNIQVIDERPLTITNPATNTTFRTRNAGLLNIDVWRDRAAANWYGPKLTKLTQGLDYNVNLATGVVTFLPRVTSNPNPFIQNLAGDIMRAYYNYTGTVSTQDYTVVTSTGMITMRYDLKAGSTVTASYQYVPWTLNRVTGNLTLTVPLVAGDQIRATYQFGVTPIPYSDVIASRTGVSNYYWGSGDLVQFTGALYGSHGSNVATQIAGRGLMTSIRPAAGAPTMFVGPRFRGMAPNAKIINIPTGLATSSIIQGWYFGVEGYDGVPGTGDEAQIITNSWGVPDPILASGFGGTERFADWLTTQYAGGKVIIVKSAGNNGYGYGTMSDEGTPGIVTVGAGSSFYYRTRPENNFDGGPYPSYGDLAYFSAWGPTTTGQTGVDIAFNGQFNYAASPLNSFSDATGAWVLTQGTSFSAPLAAGTLALVYDAYAQAHGGAFPDTATAKELLLSGADRVDFDVFTRGAGWGNALRSANLAAQVGGIRASPHSWYPGDFRGIDYPASVHLLSNVAPGNTDTGQITLTNEGSAAATVNLAATEYQRLGTATYSFTPSVPRPFMPTGQNWTVLKRGELVDWFGRRLGTYDPALWDNADVVRITASYSRTTFDAAARGIFLEPFDWTDVAPNLRFWGQSSHITAADWCSTGAWFASGGTDGVITIWDPATGLPIRQFSAVNLAGETYVNDIAISPDCSLLAAATGDTATLGTGRLHVFRTSDWTRIRRHADFAFGLPITAVAFSPDGTRYAFTSSFNFAIRMIFGLAPDDATFPDVIVRGAATGGLLSLAAGNIDWVNDVTWAPDSLTIATGSGDTNWLFDNSVLVFDTSTNPASIVAGFSGHRDLFSGAPVNGVKGVAIHTDGIRLFSAGLDGVVNEWDLTGFPTLAADLYAATGGDVMIPLTNPNVVPLSYSVTVNGAPVNEANLFLGTGDYIMLGDIGALFWIGFDSGPLVAGDLVGTTYLFQPPIAFQSQAMANSVAVSPSGTRIIVGSEGASAVLYTGGFARVGTVTPMWDTGPIVSVGFSLDSTWAFTAGYGGELDQWDALTGALRLGAPDWNGIPVSPYGLTGFFLERNRMGVYIPTANVFEMRIQSPTVRTHDGLAIWWRHLSGPVVNTPVLVEIEFFARQPWTWVTVPATPQTVPAGGTYTFMPTVIVPAGTPTGLYEGQIEVTNGADVTTIPVVANVAHMGGSIFDIQSAPGPKRLYDNGEVRSFGEDGDLRLYFFDAGDDFRLRSGQRWTVDLTLSTRSSYLVPRHTQQTPESAYSGLLFTQLNSSRYGTFSMAETNVGAPGFFKKSLDWTGAGNGVFKAMTAGAGLNVLYLQSNFLNGTSGGETFSGETGLMSLTPFPPANAGARSGVPANVATRSLASSFPVSLTTTTAWQAGPNPFEPSYGKAIAITVASSTTTNYPNQVVRQDNPNDPYTASYVRPITLSSVVSITATVVGAGIGDDLDLFFIRDANSDGVLQAGEPILASSTTPTDQESVTLALPTDGAYLIAVHGWSVPGGTTTFRLSTSILATGAAPVSATGVPASAPANSVSPFGIAWNLPSTTTDGLQSFAFFVSPGNAPLSLALLVPFNLLIDRVAPTISDLSPLPGSVIGSGSALVVANVFDTTTRQIDIYTPTMSVDGVDVTRQARMIPQFDSAVSCCYSLLTIVYDPVAPLGDGQHTSSVTVRDIAGNSATMSWSWWVDSGAPRIDLESPADGMVTGQASVVVNGRTESGATVRVAGSPVAVEADGSFMTTVALFEGPNMILVEATDLLGNLARATRTVVYDPDVPAISVRSTAGTRTRESSTIIAGTSSEPLAWATVNGAPAQVYADGSFRFPAALAEGANAFGVQVADAAGHTASTSLTVTRDTAAPVITLQPITLYIDELNQDRVWVNGTVTGADTDVVSVNGIPVLTGPGTFNREIRPLSLGANVIVIEAKDDVGNVATQTVSVTYAPVVQDIQRNYNSVILAGVAAVLLVAGFLVGFMLRRGPPAPPEAPPPAREEKGPPEPEELPAEEEMTVEEEEL